MGYSKVLFIGTDLEKAVAPYDENNKDEFVSVNHTEHYRLEYENHKDDEDFLKDYPDGTFEDFLNYWIGIPIVTKDKEAEAREKKEPFVLKDEDGELNVILYINPNTQLSYYEITHDFEGYYDYRKELAGEEKLRRDDYRQAVKALGHAPKFESWDKVVEKAKSGELGEAENQENLLELAQNYYYNQPDRKKLSEILPYVEDCIGSVADEKEYVSHNSLPYSAILTDEGWYSQLPGSYYLGVTGEPLSDKEWCKLQIKVVKKATSNPNYKAYILTTKI